ncbi:glycosyltransferase family 4 protein [uncultured Thiodictyon sp.]|uniref:glycosyltransferase family 4 protein n=1 Tax=uncultured Thiodictyon sp. TaxID=1846217 RepID=UPI0025F1AE33|nr:glycosyltransferase family 4 protein [uncultured Thiodictyon sp.]
MRLLMISPQYYPIVGGYERAAQRLSEALVSLGHEVIVISERRQHDWPTAEVLDGVQVRRLWCLYRSGLHSLTSLFSLALFLLRNGRRFDAWHVHKYGLHAALASALGILLGRPVVLKLASSAGQGLQRVTAEGRFAVMTGFLLRHVSAVVALTRETAGEAAAFGIPGERVHTLGNGIDCANFSPQDAAAKGRMKRLLGLGEANIIISIGRLSEEKNPHGLLHAWEIARDLLSSDWILVLVGDGPMRIRVESIILDRSLTDRVRVVGQQENIAQWMGAGDIYVLSSTNEGLSNTLLEAMACGLPVAATRVSGVSELVEESRAGLAVDVGDMDALGQALVRLGCDASLCAQMGSRGRRVVEGRYAIEPVAAAHEALYRRLIADRAR